MKHNAEKEVRAVERIFKALSKAQADLTAKRAQRELKCCCGASHAINTLELLVTHWYTEPHGCTGGDYWSEGEFEFVCPTSSARNRLMFNDFDVDYKRRGSDGAEPAFKRLYRSLFASRRDTYREDPGVRWINNEYADKNRAYFELPEKIVKKE